MNIREADERDSTWEDPEPVFRVYLFRKYDERYGLVTSAYDVSDADLLEVAEWAQDQVAGIGMYAVALVSERTMPGDEAPTKGLTWLLGIDANIERQTPREEALFARMQDLRDKRIRIV